MCTRSKWWLYDGMCQDCEFHAPGNTLSLNMPVSNEDGNEITLLDTLVDLTPSIEEIIFDKAELDQLFYRLNELIPEAICIEQLHHNGLFNEVIAEIISIKHIIFLSRLKKVKEQARHRILRSLLIMYGSDCRYGGRGFFKIFLHSFVKLPSSPPVESVRNMKP